MYLERDAVVVGAGPAGCAAALGLARAGCRVSVIDARTAPGDSPCGEGIMPAGVSALAELGLARIDGGRPFTGITFHTRGGEPAAGRFPEWAHGLGLPRIALHRLLWARLAAHPGIELFAGHCLQRIRMRGERVTGVDARARATGRSIEIAAELTIGADGLRSRFHGLPGVSVSRPARRRFGLCARLGGVADLGTRVEVHPVPRGEVYVTPQQGDVASIAVVVEESSVGRPLDPRVTFLRLVAAAPGLARRAAGARLLDTPRWKGPLGSTVRGAAGPGWLLAGDAAGALDPITGEGVALGLSLGAALGRHALALGPSPEAARRALAERRALERPMRAITAALLWLSAHPAWADRAVLAAGAFPRAFSALLAVAAGRPPREAALVPYSPSTLTGRS